MWKLYKAIHIENDLFVDKITRHTEKKTEKKIFLLHATNIIYNKLHAYHRVHPL